MTMKYFYRNFQRVILFITPFMISKVIHFALSHGWNHCNPVQILSRKISSPGKFYSDGSHMFKSLHLLVYALLRGYSFPHSLSLSVGRTWRSIFPANQGLNELFLLISVITVTATSDHLQSTVVHGFSSQQRRTLKPRLMNPL